MEAFRDLAERLHEAGPLSARERRLAKLGIAIGRESEGGVRSHARKALAEGIEREAIRQVALLAISTGGYPAAMAAFGWNNEVLDREGLGNSRPSASFADGLSPRLARGQDGPGGGSAGREWA
jgi:alkylhydroperoxidase/carboxymuconolactone decarboxylase family protein YurZ